MHAGIPTVAATSRAKHCAQAGDGRPQIRPGSISTGAVRWDESSNRCWILKRTIYSQISAEAARQSGNKWPVGGCGTLVAQRVQRLTSMAEGSDMYAACAMRKIMLSQY